MSVAPPSPTGSPSGSVSTGPKGTSRAPVRKPDRLWRVVLGVAVAVQLIAVYSPYGASGPSITGFDKVVHASIFAAPALAALMAGISAPWALGILAVHAPVSELIQHFLLSHRLGDVFDVMANFGGVALGGLVYLVWSRRRH